MYGRNLFFNYWEENSECSAFAGCAFNRNLGPSDLEIQSFSWRY